MNDKIKKLTISIIGSLLIASIPAAITGYSSYKTSKDESSIRTQVAYETLSEAVKKLQNQVEAIMVSNAELRGQVRVLNSLLKSSKVVGGTITSVEPSAAPPAPAKPEPKFDKLELPTLDKAVQAYQIQRKM